MKNYEQLLTHWAREHGITTQRAYQIKERVGARRDPDTGFWVVPIGAKYPEPLKPGPKKGKRK